ncbi:MAG: nucleotidyltransferase domain-containing protein [Candidatus Caldarchaeum sp.]|nr:nucleotidyltransferase domain-containing protein [Candidatus Caldarchaeum sp.]
MLGLVEGCYFFDRFGDVYAVKGVVHPPGRVYAVPRIIDGVETKNLQQSICLAAEKNPSYVFQDPYLGRAVIAVPEPDVKQPLYPSKRIKGPTDLVEAAKRLSSVLSDAGVDHGFSGSLLLGTADEKSDIDIVIYGGEKEYQIIKQLRQRKILQPVDMEVLEILAESRLDTPQSPPSIQTEAEKFLTGKYAKHLYTMKIVPKTFWETWEDTKVTPEGSVEMVVQVVDDSHGFYTPAKYVVRNVGEGLAVTEVISFRSRFSEMGVSGDRLLVKGLLEKVVKPGCIYHRVNVGLGVSDYIKPVNV